MAKNGYIGVDGVARKIGKYYIGDENNIARKVTKAYIGDANNVARLCYVAHVHNFTTARWEYVDAEEHCKVLRCDCGEEYGENLPHEFEFYKLQNAGSDWHNKLGICVCGAQDTIAIRIPHEFVNFKKCIYISPEKHYKVFACDCGEEYGENLPHEFVNGKCECGYSDI